MEPTNLKATAAQQPDGQGWVHWERHVAREAQAGVALFMRLPVSHPDPEDLRVPTEHGHLFARRWRGDGASRVPIVLFHDSLGCVDLWREFPAQLAAATGRSVIAYDRLGFGRSSPHPGVLTSGFIHDEAKTGVRALREALGIGAFIAFGHSVGGGMAVACAATYPDDCLALITESAQAFVEDRTLQGIREARASFARPGQVERLQRHHGDKAPWVLHAWIDTWLAPGFADWRLDDDLREVRCPVLAIHGDQDEFGSVKHPERIGALAAGPATVRVLEGIGHVPHREVPGTVTSLATQWLAAHVAEPGL